MIDETRPDTMWPHVVEIQASRLVDGRLARVSVSMTMELLTDMAGPLAHYLTSEINRTFDEQEHGGLLRRWTSP